MRILIASDLHLDDNPKHEYRWEFMRILREMTVDQKIDAVMILGDLTDKKDRHRSQLVNRVADEIFSLRSLAGDCVIILKGNHDYIDEDNPFFGFFRNVDGVHYVSDSVLGREFGPQYSDMGFIGHTREPSQFFSIVQDMKKDVPTLDQLFVHQTFKGSKVTGNFELDGLDPEFRMYGMGDVKVISGDIHIPQIVGQVEYVGAPYPVHYGDSWDYRMLKIVDGERSDVRLSWPAMASITCEADSFNIDVVCRKHNLKDGDSVKLTIIGSPMMLQNWWTVRETIMELFKSKNIEVHAIRLQGQPVERVVEMEQKEYERLSPEQVISDFCKEKNYDERTQSIGVSIVKG